MVPTYSILGRQIGSHYLAIATLASIAGISALSMSGGSSPKKAQTPPLNAKSSDEENFIKEFLKNAELAEEKK